tara:strand:+ start:378 stop:665 length:288 start_codon:yes stop_codon:yes gene_type:complete
MATIIFSPAPGTALVQEIKKTDVEKKSSGLLLPTNAQNETVKRCLVISACNTESSNVETNNKVVIRGTDLKDIITFNDDVFHIIKIENILGKIEN